MICSNCIIHTYKKDWDKNHNVNVGYFGDMITVKQNKTFFLHTGLNFPTFVQ